MGKKTLPLLFLLLLSFSGTRSFAQCSAHKIAKSFRPNLNPYKYDSYAYNEVTFGEQSQTIEVLFTAFSGMKYKLVFGTSMFDENVKVNIYDKSMKTHKRNKLYDNSNGVDNLFWAVEVDTPGVYYIDYEVPAKGANSSSTGCMVLLIGYLEK